MTNTQIFCILFWIFIAIWTGFMGGREYERRAQIAFIDRLLEEREGTDGNNV